MIFNSPGFEGGRVASGLWLGWTLNITWWIKSAPHIPFECSLVPPWHFVGEKRDTVCEYRL